MIGEYRLTIRVRNNLLLRRIEATRGFVSLPKFCAKHGLRYTWIAGLISMKVSPVSLRTGTWLDSVERLASILRADPADLFPERQVRGEILTTTVEREVGDAELLALSAPAALALIEDHTPERFALDNDLAAKLLDTLPEREKALIIAYFGLGGAPAKSVDELAEEYGVVKARCHQLIRKATTRMRSALYRRHQLMSGERYHELEEAEGNRDAWSGRDAF